MHALGVLTEAEIYVDDSAILRMPEIRARPCACTREQRLDLIIVDYLQLIHGGRGDDNRVAEISYISRSLKELARELDVPVIAASQLSRAPELRTPHIPLLSDLRRAAASSRTPTWCVHLPRGRLRGREQWQANHPQASGDTYPAGIAQIIVAKHRNGPTGTVHLRFRQRIAKFEDLLVREPEEAV